MDYLCMILLYLSNLIIISVSVFLSLTMPAARMKIENAKVCYDRLKNEYWSGVGSVCDLSRSGSPLMFIHTKTYMHKHNTYTDTKNPGK
jgi:hypothetical protein